VAVGAADDRPGLPLQRRRGGAPTRKGHSRHNHPGVEEILYVIAGEGHQMVEDAAGRPVRRPVRPGVLVPIPPDVYHETINTGWKPLELLAVYCPAGPEALLRQMAGRVLPPGAIPGQPA